MLQQKKSDTTFERLAQTRREYFRPTHKHDSDFLKSYSSAPQLLLSQAVVMTLQFVTQTLDLRSYSQFQGPQCFFVRPPTSYLCMYLVFQSISSYFLDDNLSLNQNMTQVGHLSTKLTYIGAPPPPGSGTRPGYTRARVGYPGYIEEGGERLICLCHKKS